MDPSSRETSGISLPPPVAEQAPGPAAAANPQERQRISTPETAPRAGTVPSDAALSGVAPPAAPVPGQSGSKIDDTSTTPTIASPVLDDGDKIEKEWVEKIKRIIAATRHDPYKQSEELTAVKADYMKQRYNKIIKVEK